MWIPPKLSLEKAWMRYLDATSYPYHLLSVNAYKQSICLAFRLKEYTDCRVIPSTSTSSRRFLIQVRSISESEKDEPDHLADASRVDFRNPEHFHHDVNSVAGLLKQFFRELPDPLMTSELYLEFLAAARIEDVTVRRDSVHAVINSLPDPNYATLRVLILVRYKTPA